ncbi:Leader peptidase (Prepilin peptidase) [Rhodopirellula islandica]|uniref:Leader peptidase (Prepilin peptidase) n=1 Tax=Rhodopirellula islandica TaxID=595434 RepID=A0A0J1BC20_RHOIS|nr:A24 family peptidase [Rhodopirellula islandica]KLU04093.1 Leader peptidase (Prepilin peptidase) [Rhodopirellula islandica]
MIDLTFPAPVIDSMATTLIETQALVQIAPSIGMLAEITPIWLAGWLTAWLALSPTTQTAILALLGILGGALANHIIPTWCWYPRPISPWVDRGRWPLLPEFESISRTLPARTWADRIPVLGWFRLRREAEMFGRWFWVRPILIELSLAATLPFMHRAYLAGQLLPTGVTPATVAACTDWMALLFFLHAAFLVWLVAATFIDFDERTIPDLLTIPGTIVAIGLGTLTPFAFLPGLVVNNSVEGIAPVLANHPFGLSPFWTSPRGLMTGLAIWAVWCFALADRRFYLRRGWSKAWGYFWFGLTRHNSWKFLVAMWLVGSALIVVTYSTSPIGWMGMMTSLTGLAVGGGIVWIVRLVCGWAIQMEAMGFGDVTLMAMIGALIGWQGSILAFFLSPIAALVIVLVVFVLTRDPRTPFGPYLCLGTLLVVWYWDDVYNARFRTTLLLMGDVLLWMAVAMPPILASMMWITRKIRLQVLPDAD